MVGESNKIFADEQQPVEEPKNNEPNSWKNWDTKKRIKVVAIVTIKVLSLLMLLYLFVCALDLMSSGFRLVGGKATGKVFAEGAILSNPIAGLMIGLLTTVLVQSSSTSTSIIVAMVSSETLSVQRAIPMVMGANIGTSVTNTLVALTQSGNREEFRRAFAGATVHDMFNWLSVLVLLPLEIVSGMLFHLTDGITKLINFKRNSNSNPEFLTVITKPLTERIVQLDRKAIQTLALQPNRTDINILKRYCSFKNESDNGTFSLVPNRHCSFLFAKVPWAEWIIGLVLLLIAIICLCFCLIVLVKILQSLLKGTVKNLIFKVVNSNLPGRSRYFTPYLAILVGCILTILVQSSSIFTSTLTPLVGLGIITVDRVYPFTLGSNIGTTVTGIMAALTASSNELKNSIQIALCHTFFNIFGILLWFPIPFMRFPIPMAKKLGEITATYRWFAVVYIIAAFFLIPLIVFGLSLAGWYVFGGVLGPIALILIAVVVINLLQSYRPQWLPNVLKTWSWLPRPLRTLAWYDEHLCGRRCCCCCCGKTRVEPTTNEYLHKNESYTQADNVDYL